MNRLQIGLIVGGLGLVALLYTLPRVVVENETLVDPDSPEHTLSIPQEVKAQIGELRMKWEGEVEIEKKLNFADSLAGLYLDYQVLDSAIWFTGYIKGLKPDEWRVRVSDLYYRAFQLARTPEEAREMGLLSGNELKKLLDEYPENSSLKNRLAMTMVVTENPMSGIQMLRDILMNDPKDTEAIKNLGILSIQSGQFEKAEGRFKDLLAIDSADEEALFYLGMCQIELGKPGGMEIMQRLSDSENPAIRSLAIEYLEN